MNGLIKKLHMYTGLLNFSILLVFGVAGLLAGFQPAPEKRTRPPLATRYEPFAAPPGLTDQEVADRVYQHLRPPLGGPVPDFALRRDAAQNLSFNFYTPNGFQRVVVLEKESRLLVETQPNDIWHFFSALHETMMRHTAGREWPVRLWGYYNEFAIWSLIGMAVSGVYLWLSSRPGYWPAVLSFAAGGGIFLLLYLLTR